MAVRNFSIIAHIDHGKTTLSDRLLQTTGTVPLREMSERMLDDSSISQERGITISLAPVRMQWPHPVTGEMVELNLIDTPGHVDFSYEVSRSLAACEGVLLVVDATQGIQAQTLANFEKAQRLHLKVIPVINKIDLPAADPEGVMLEVMETLGLPESDIVCVSAKSGQNIPALLDKIVLGIPEPNAAAQAGPLRALVFTSLFDVHQGVIAYVRVVSGELRRESLAMMANGEVFLPTEIGYFAPDRQPCAVLRAGEVGYVATGLKDVSLVTVGDTITAAGALSVVQALPGYKEPQPMVYLELYPIDGDDFVLLQDAMNKLKLHDAALQFIGTHSKALGNGLRVGFLGILHADIIRERLEREFDLDLIATAPSVSHEIVLTSGEVIVAHHAGELPDPSLIREMREPMTRSVIFTRRDVLGTVMQLCEDHRGTLEEIIDMGVRVRVVYRLPLAELIVNFHDQLKSVSSGFASMEYELIGFEKVDATKLSILIHGEAVEALAQIVVRSQADHIGRAILKKLKEVIPRQQFEISLQAAVGGKILARESISAWRKDVTAKLYGGDDTRRQTLLKKQKRGKKRMKEIGKVQLPQSAFLAVLER
jgi:GTP-binding protein LepA